MCHSNIEHWTWPHPILSPFFHTHLLLWMWFIRKGSLSIPLTQLQKFLYHNPSRSANGWIFTKYFFSESVCWAEDGCTLAAQIGGDFSPTIVNRGNAWNDLRQFGFWLQWQCEEGHDGNVGPWDQGLVLAAYRAGQRDDCEHQDVSKRSKLGDPAPPSSPSRPSSSNRLAGGGGPHSHTPKVGNNSP